MAKSVIITVLFGIVGVMFSLACIGGKQAWEKDRYAVMAVIMLVLMLISSRLGA